MSLTKVDKILNCFKNNKIISVIIVLVLISMGLNKFIGSAKENITFFQSFLNKYVLNRQKVINKVQESGKNEIVDKMEDQSPAVVSDGNVTISYGVSQETYNTLVETLKGNQKTLNRLLKTLDEKDIDIKDRDAEIQKWIEKYKELESRLTLRSTEDTLDAQAKEKLDAGDLEGAEKLLQQSLERKKQHIDTMKKAAASDSYVLGLIKELQLDYQGARNYFKQTLEYDSENSEYLNKYGLILIILGNSKEAIEYFTKALDIKLKVHGEGLPKVAECYNNLGAAWSDLGYAKKAIEYYTKALDINLKLYGEMHPTVAARYNNLGSAWNHLGYAKKAIEYYTKALDIDLKVYGEMHPHVAIRYNNLGLAWDTLGDAKKAIEYYTKALDIDLKVYGEMHPTVATRYNNLGSAWNHLGDSKKAIEYHTKALDIDLKVYGEEHPDVARDYNNLGLAWDHLGDAKKAIEYYTRALDILKATYGDSHPKTIQAKSNLEFAKKSLKATSQ